MRKQRKFWTRERIVLDAAVLGRAITEQVPCPDCAALRSERDEVAWALGQLLTGDETAIRLVRAGRIGREAKS